MSTALLPRVRAMVVCDEVASSELEAEVFTLEGVRYGFGADSFPCARDLSAYLLLSYPRSGQFSGEVKVVPYDESKLIRVAKFTANFDASPGIQALTVDLANCTFPEAETYIIQVWFWTTSGGVLKKDEPFQVWQLE